MCRVINAACALLLVLTACSLGRQPADDDLFGSSVTPMDHDPSFTYVRKVFVDGNWVGSAGTGGSTVASGISLPVKWRPGLTAVVKWERCEPFFPENPVPDEEACKWHEKVVPIHEYDLVGATHLHIMPGDEVVIIPSMMGPNHPNYPGPGYPEKDFFADLEKAQSIKDDNE